MIDLEKLDNLFQILFDIEEYGIKTDSFQYLFGFKPVFTLHEVFYFHKLDS